MLLCSVFKVQKEDTHRCVPSKLNNVRTKSRISLCFVTTFDEIRRRAARAAVISPSKRSDLGSLWEWLPTCLLRKEVIQPLVLERLPCYDFTPITKPTFGRVLQRLDYGLRVFPALMV